MKVSATTSELIRMGVCEAVGANDEHAESRVEAQKASSSYPTFSKKLGNARLL